MTQLTKNDFDELSIVVKMINRHRDRLSFLKYGLRTIDQNSYVTMRREVKKVQKLLSQCKKQYKEITGITY